MGQHRIEKYLFDIRTSIEAIDEYLGPKRDFTAYQQSKLLRRAVERELEIIGEAVGRILQLDAEITIESARKIVSLRNHVIHGYDKIEDETIWGIIINHLPRLREDVDRLL